MKTDEKTPYRAALDALERMMDPTETVEFWGNLGKEKIMVNCAKCGSVDGNCCAAAKARLETADILGGLVERQSDQITTLTRELSEAKQVNADLRESVAAWKKNAYDVVVGANILRERAEAAESDAAVAKFDMETYKTRALNAESRIKSKGVE